MRFKIDKNSPFGQIHMMPKQCNPKKFFYIPSYSYSRATVRYGYTPSHYKQDTDWTDR